MADANTTIHPMTLLMVATLRPLTIGDVVIYHGSQTEYHDEEFVVTAIGTDGRMRIVRREYQEDRLTDVRRRSVTPTGEHVDICECGHSVDSNRYHPLPHPYCGAFGCACPKHSPKKDAPAPLGKAAELLLVEISRTARNLREGVSRSTRDLAEGAIHFDGSRFVHRGIAGAQLEALVSVARHYIRECPELGLTRELLDTALTGDTAALFRN